MVVGAKLCELTDGFLWFVCGNFDVSPYIVRVYMINILVCMGSYSIFFHTSRL